MTLNGWMAVKLKGGAPITINRDHVITVAPLSIGGCRIETASGKTYVIEDDYDTLFVRVENDDYHDPINAFDEETIRILEANAEAHALSREEPMLSSTELD